MQTFHGALPMIYTVQGFRVLLSTGDYAFFAARCAGVVLILGGFLLAQLFHSV